MLLIRICLICTIVFFVNSCTKSDSRPITSLRLQKIALSRGDSLGFILFKYAQDNKLIKIIVSDDNYGITGITTTLAYDSAGRVSTFTYSNADAPYLGSDTLAYYNNGAIVKKTGISRIGGSHVYSYDSKQRLISDSALSGNSAKGYATFRYDANDNLIEWNCYSYFPWDNIWARFGNTFFSYDNRKSPFGDLSQILYIIRGDFEWLGKNNVTQTKYFAHTWPTVFTYEYTADGLPKKVSGTQNNEVVSTLEYYYD